MNYSSNTPAVDPTLEAQYNVRAAVPEQAAIVARWQARSAAFRARADCRLELAYGPGARETLDFFVAGEALSPLHIFLHGGYWQAMDKRLFSFIAEALVARGVSVAIVNYPLCPVVTLDRIIAAVRRACVWLWRQAADLAVDPSRIQLAGHGAGGHLAAMLMATDWPRVEPTLPRQILHSAVAVSGLFELEPLCHTSLNRALGLDAASVRRNSPARLAPVVRAPLLLAVGARESAEFRRQTSDFAEVWRGQGMTVDTLTLPGCHHFAAVEQLAAPGSPLLTATLERLGR